MFSADFSWVGWASNCDIQRVSILLLRNFLPNQLLRNQRWYIANILFDWLAWLFDWLVWLIDRSFGGWTVVWLACLWVGWLFGLWGCLVGCFDRSAGRVHNKYSTKRQATNVKQPNRKNVLKTRRKPGQNERPRKATNNHHTKQQITNTTSKSNEHPKHT